MKINNKEAGIGPFLNISFRVLTPGVIFGFNSYCQISFYKTGFHKRIKKTFNNRYHHLRSCCCHAPIIFALLISVTRFGEISPLWQNLRVHLVLGKILNTS